MCISAVLIFSLKQTPLPENAQKHMRPYMIRNCTGYDLQFWNMSDDAGVSDTGSNKHFLKDGEEMPWTFRDWKRRREVNIHAH